ncbi:MAG: hypothetical protein H6850_00245 [Alphaproteobacteria bacterium]|nr:MAG: hypothetical protein H6850_00245 [Alphaproteobacteria bacterium]
MIKVSIIGANPLGTTLAFCLAQKTIYDLCLVDTKSYQDAEKKALDIMQSLAIKNQPITCPVKGALHMEEIKHSDVVIITEGANYAGKKHSDLLFQNSGVIEEIAKDVKKYAPDAFVIIATNPVDTMVWHFQKSASLPEHRVVGMSGVLNTNRFRYALSKALNVNINDIQTLVIGSHNHDMIPLIEHTFIQGISFVEYAQRNDIAIEDIEVMIQGVKNAHQTMIYEDQDLPAYFGATESVIKILESYIFNQKQVLSCCVNLNMAEPENDICINLPSIIGENGVEEILMPELSEEDEEKFRETIKILLKQNVTISFSKAPSRVA